MVDDFGQSLTDTQLMDRILDMGAVVVRRGPVESQDFPTWRRGLRQNATGRGVRVHVRQLGDGKVLVSNPDHEVDPQRLRAAINSLPTATDLGLG